jgi:hypothetical protein
MAGQDWKITRRHDVCSGCEAQFDEGALLWSLVHVADGELAREDLCRSCFEGRATAEADEVVWWRTKNRAERKRGLQLDLEALEALFLALEDRTEQKMRELRYLLCLILMRKRRLKVVRVLRDAEGEAFTLRRPRRSEELKVFVFELGPERQDELRGELLRIFDEPGLGGAIDEAGSGDATEAEEAAADGQGSGPESEPEQPEPVEPAERAEQG